ncbi:major facilitator superfamily domain-containing protein [Lactarius hatsudake]|nr:major facilitator superfamily domain-containing protein [Lactarius hatsudake]
MENDRHGELEHLRGPIDDPARELDTCRADALAAIDKAPFSWVHVKVCLVTATISSPINLASVMLGYVYGHTDTTQPSCPSPRPSSGQLSPGQEFGIKVAAPIGNLFGQLLFGWLADILGRKRMYGIELMIIITATLVQALVGSGQAVNIIGVIAFWRFVMGVGVGGDYPLSAVITSEFAPTSFRGRLMTAVFTTQGWGNFAASLVALIVTAAYKDSIISGGACRVDYCWRILIGLGCVPGAIALYFRLTIPETPRFTMDIDRDIQRAAMDIDNVLDPRGSFAGVYWVDPDSYAVVQRADVPRHTRSDFMAHFGRWSNLQLLIGVAYSWFAIDASHLLEFILVAFYGLGLNSSAILTSNVLTNAGIGYNITSVESNSNSTMVMYKTLHNIAEGSLVVSLAGLLPGYYATFFLIDVWGRKPIQFMGFSALAVLLAIIAGIYPGSNPDPDQGSKTKAFVALYCLANFFANFGPNVTTFIIPGEIFPTRYRSTAHGIAAASGKLGAILSQIIIFKVGGSDTILDTKSVDNKLRVVLGIFAGVSLTGIASTWLLEETKNRSLEELSQEQRGFIRGVAQVEMRNGIVRALPNTQSSLTP